MVQNYMIVFSWCEVFLLTTLGVAVYLVRTGVKSPSTESAAGYFVGAFMMMVVIGLFQAALVEKVFDVLERETPIVVQ